MKKNSILFLVKPAFVGRDEIQAPLIQFNSIQFNFIIHTL